MFSHFRITQARRWVILLKLEPFEGPAAERQFFFGTRLNNFRDIVGPEMGVICDRIWFVLICDIVIIQFPYILDDSYLLPDFFQNMISFWFSPSLWRDHLKKWCFYRFSPRWWGLIAACRSWRHPARPIWVTWKPALGWQAKRWPWRSYFPWSLMYSVYSLWKKNAKLSLCRSLQIFANIRNFAVGFTSSVSRVTS